MSAKVENSRPNIRIQIQNTVAEESETKMEVDQEEIENEEGEISDGNENHIQHHTEHRHPAPKEVISGIFTTGINIFDKKEQEKLQERAKRFALKPDEINSFTDQDLQDLYDSLGINPTNESEVKFETVHVHGFDEMSAEDIIDYFASYAPEGIEWIDENSCNIVWLDNLSAARGLHFKSKAVKGMPAREPKEIFPKEFLDEVEEPDQETGQSILIKNKNREVELQNEIGEVLMPVKKSYPKNSVDISEISIPIPPGYWRLGSSHLKTKCLLMRYGFITDKLPFKSEKCSKYYKKLVNPGQRNVISESKKKELRSIFERNRELNQSKNPWGSLAKNWDQDAKFREREPVIYNVDEDEDHPVVEVKNPKLLARLGTKRKLNTELEDQKPEDKEETNEIRNWTSEKKKTKMPRMKMYADEEEENMKRKKLLQSIKKQVEEIDKQESERDLRNMLGPTSRMVTKKDVPELEPTVDLGTKLKNRSQKMIFAIERDLFDQNVRAQVMDGNHHRHSERNRDRSPLVSRSVMLYQRERRERRHSPERKRKDMERSQRSSRKTPEGTLHSDRIYSRSSHVRRRSYSQERRYGHKPRSKVAVVIKTQKKPAVASTIWSKVRKSSESERSSSEQSESNSSTSSSSSSSDSESEESDDNQSDSSESSQKRSRNPDRPGFDKKRLTQKLEHKSPLKITMANDHYKKHRK